jgi:uncharacterized protein YkwD
MKTKLFNYPEGRFPNRGRSVLVATTFAFAVSACGGGGSESGTATPVTTSTPVSPEVTPALVAVTSSYSGFQLSAFNRLNAARVSAGVSALEQNAQLDAAAQAHALYMGRNRVLGHYETPTVPFFTAVDPKAVHRYKGTKAPS